MATLTSNLALLIERVQAAWMLADNKQRQIVAAPDHQDREAAARAAHLKGAP